jgi:glycosyltransferase involved in cell wall biosynthesis
LGGGTRLKVIEALAMGKAVVSTQIGCEGLQVRNGEHLLIADTPESFAQAVLRLLDDSKLCERLGGNGRALVEEGYSHSYGGRQLAGLYHRAIQDRNHKNRIKRFLRYARLRQQYLGYL